jgi:sugar lactone lactonase YvrE
MKKIYPFTIKQSFIRFIIFFILNSSFFIVKAQSYNISTIAGDSSVGYSGDGGPATTAELDWPWGVAIDKTGNVYIADDHNYRIRKVSPAGVISTFAGNGTAGFSGDNGPASAAELSYPTGVAIDTLGNLYIADENNNRIRKVDATGKITTYAGTGVVGFGGDGGPATNAKFNTPAGVAVDKLGNLYVADFYNYRVRKITTAGVISTVAGDGSYGFGGDGGPATNAKIGSILGVGVDLSGNIYIPDQSNGRIRKVDVSGVITTFAGGATQGYSGDWGLATDAELSYPYGVCADASGNIYIADYNNARVRVVKTDGIITTIAGTGYPAYYGDGGPATDAEISYITGVGVDEIGDIYIADENNARIRKLVPFVDGIDQVTSNNNQLRVYPNPSSGRFYFQTENGKSGIENVKIEIYNAFGQQVFSQLSTINSQFSIDLTSQSNGIYFYKVAEDGNLLGEGKIIIQK